MWNQYSGESEYWQPFSLFANEQLMYFNGPSGDVFGQVWTTCELSGFTPGNGQEAFKETEGGTFLTVCTFGPHCQHEGGQKADSSIKYFIFLFIISTVYYILF